MERTHVHTQTQIIERIQVKLRRLKKSGRYSMREGLSDTAIEDVCVQNSLELPNELQIWLSVCNGISGTKKHNPIVFGSLFGATSDRLVIPDIFSEYYNNTKWELNNWIPIADDGFGNFYCLVPYHSENNVKHVVAFFDACDSADELCDTPSYVSRLGCLDFVNYLLIDEIMYAEKSFDKFDINSYFFYHE